MKRKSLRNAFLLFVMFNLIVGCLMSDGDNKAKPKGTVDGGGGGNTICGRPIDAFRVNLLELPEFQKYIDPIYQYFNSPVFRGCKNCQVHNFAVGGYMTSMIFNKGWYIVPCQIEQISKEKVGSIYETEQVAVQTFDDVWIDQEKFNSLSEQDRGLILFHEIIMGIKILKFDSYFNQCKALSPEGYDICNVGVESKMVRGDLRKLTTKDYTDVRIVTHELFNNYLKYDLHTGLNPNPSEPPSPPSNEPKNLFSNELFRTYNFSNRYHIWSRSQNDSPKRKVGEILNNLNQSKLTGSTPRYTNYSLYEDKFYLAKSLCEFDFEYNKTAKKLKLFFKTTNRHQSMTERESSFELILDENEEFEGYYNEKFKNDEIETSEHFDFPRSSFEYDENFKKVGDRKTKVHLEFSFYGNLIYWSIGQMVCTSSENDRCTQSISVDSDLDQTCSTIEKFSKDGEEITDRL